MKQINDHHESIIPQTIISQFHINRFPGKDGTPCADVIIRDPDSGKNLKKRVSAKNGGEVLQNRIQAAMRELYLQVRPALMKCMLADDGLTLKRYLDYDLPYLRTVFPKSISERDISFLLQYADKLTAPLKLCTSADDFLPALRDLDLNREQELVVLRMVSDSLTNLAKIGLCAGNPLSTYLAEAKKNFNRVKAEQREPSNRALPSYAAAAILAEYDRHILEDARYIAVPFALLGIPSNIISALNFSNLTAIEDVLSLRIDSKMDRPSRRLCERPLENIYQVRMLCVDFLRSEINYWRDKYASLGIDLSAKKVPLCAFGCRAQPKRCSPEEIDAFLKSLLDRCHSGSHPFAARTYHKTFLVFGEEILGEKPYHALYLLGQSPETVDERVYISFTNPRIQREMSDMVKAIFDEMRKGDSIHAAA